MLILRNLGEEIFKLNIIVIVHSSFAVTKFVMMRHVWFHVIKENFSLIKHSVYGQFLSLKINNNYLT